MYVYMSFEFHRCPSIFELRLFVKFGHPESITCHSKYLDLFQQHPGGEGASLTNLSHDSGLTTSDSQLYAFDGVENNSFSSSDDLRKLSAASSGIGIS